jgi:hypothetical protein
MSPSKQFAFGMGFSDITALVFDLIDDVWLLIR